MRNLLCASRTLRKLPLEFGKDPAVIRQRPPADDLVPEADVQHSAGKFGGAAQPDLQMFKLTANYRLLIPAVNGGQKPLFWHFEALSNLKIFRPTGKLHAVA